MVGHFLHPNRKNRSDSGDHSRTSSGAAHVAAPPSVATVGASLAYNPPSAMSQTSRYTGASPSYDAASMAYMPPQNLTAEAVAALPPPGMFT